MAAGNWFEKVTKELRSLIAGDVIEDSIRRLVQEDASINMLNVLQLFIRKEREENTIEFDRFRREAIECVRRTCTFEKIRREEETEEERFVRVKKTNRIMRATVQTLASL